MTAALTVAAEAPRVRTRIGELLMVGGLTPLLFPLSWLLRRKLGLDDAASKVQKLEWKVK